MFKRLLFEIRFFFWSLKNDPSTAEAHSYRLKYGPKRKEEDLPYTPSRSMCVEETEVAPEGYPENEGKLLTYNFPPNHNKEDQGTTIYGDGPPDIDKK